MRFMQRKRSSESLVGKNLTARQLPTPLFVMAMSLWGTCAGCLTALLSAERIALSWVVVALLTVVVGIALVLTVSAQVGAIVAGVGLGFLLAFAGAHTIWQGQLALENESGQHSFEVIEDGSETDFGTRCVARVLDISGQPRVQVLLSEQVDTPHFGERFEGFAQFQPIQEKNRSFMWQKGIAAQAKCSSYVSVQTAGIPGLLAALRSQALKAILSQQSEGSGVLAALVCGWRNDVPDTTNQAFKTAGLAHVLAVSGAHLSVLVALVSAILKRLSLHRIVAVGVQVLLVAAFVLFSGASPSVLRAATMAILAMCSVFASRRSVPLQALGLCVICGLALSPISALSVSFALSVLATLGIMVFAPLFKDWVAFAFKGRCDFLSDALSVCLAANAATLPLSAALFSQIPLIGVVANLVVSPLFAPLCTLCVLCVLGSLLIPLCAPLVIPIARLACGWFAVLVGMLARFPGACMAVDVPVVGMLVVTAIALVVLWVWWPKPSAKRWGVVGASFLTFWVVFALAAPWVAAIVAGNSVVMLDVGQGDAFLLRSRGKTVLIDTGNQERLLKEALARNHITKLDGVLITHGDDDHMGCLASLAGYVSVEQVFVANDALTCSCNNCETLRDAAVEVVGKSRMFGLNAEDVISVGDFSCEVLWPEGFQDEGGNGDSVCLRVDLDADHDTHPEWQALFTGDAETDVIETLVSTGAVADVDLLKVGHHGSTKSLNQKITQKLSPEIAFIGVGEYNRYGHPNAEILGILEDAEVSVFRTDVDGDVSCKIEGKTMTITTRT